MLTNFKFTNEDSLALAFGAKEAEKKKSKDGFESSGELGSLTDRILFEDPEEIEASHNKFLDETDQLKRDAMAKIMDLTNGSGEDVFRVNMETAVFHFARFEGDTGSPEVQGSHVCGKALTSSWRFDGQDFKVE
jgi:hypothetical protein